MACGEMGLSIAYFYTLTPREFYNIQMGYFKKADRLLQDDWLQTKVLSYFVYMGIPKKKGSKNLSFPEFTNTFFQTKKEYQLPTTELSKEEKIERSRAFFDKIEQQKNGGPIPN